MPAIVDALAERWGVEEAWAGKVVWAELSLTKPGGLAPVALDPGAAVAAVGPSGRTGGEGRPRGD
jgi:hypothetical protein